LSFESKSGSKEPEIRQKNLLGTLPRLKKENFINDAVSRLEDAGAIVGKILILQRKTTFFYVNVCCFSALLKKNDNLFHNFFQVL